MKNLFKKVFGLFAAFVMVFGLASCNKVTEKTAEKIRVAAAKKDAMTYAEVVDLLGEEEGGILLAGNGVLTWYSKTDSAEESTELRKSGKSDAIITVTFVQNKAVDATYSVLDPIESND